MDHIGREVTFNMAIATLSRLDKLIERMQLTSLYSNDLTEQRFQIKLLKYFYFNAVPLLANINSKLIKDFKEEILNMKPKTRMIKGKYIEIYDSKLERRILEIAIDIVIELKEHFMPVKSEEDDDEL